MQGLINRQWACVRMLTDELDRSHSALRDAALRDQLREEKKRLAELLVGTVEA